MITDEPTIYKNLLNQFFELWINPEVTLRQEAKELPEDFILKKAQVIFSLVGKPIIRINDEVKVIAKAKINRSVKKGEAIFEKDVSEIKELKLVEEDTDFGHITIVRFRDSWVIGFNFLYQLENSKSLYDLGLEFLDSSRVNFHNGNWRSAIECLSVAAENLAKAKIYLYPDWEIRKSRKHGTVWAKVNQYHKSNLISSSTKDTFNGLMQCRDLARYQPGFTIQKELVGAWIKSLQLFSDEINETYLQHSAIYNSQEVRPDN